MDLSKLQAENEELKRKLEEAESTLDAIRNGEVDAVLVGGKQVYTLTGADFPYRVLVEAMQQGAVTVTSAGLIVYCNHSFSEMIGRPFEKVMGLSVQTLFSAADRSALEQGLADPANSKQIELSLNTGDTSSLPVLVSFTTLSLEEEFGICLVITDLTEQKQKQQLLDTHRRKDEFLAMLAHELRNPLAPIYNAAQMIALWNKSKSKEILWGCEVIDRQVQQMTRLIDDLLDVSRITRGKINLKRAIVDVSVIVEAAVETSRPLIESKNHRIHMNIGSTPMKVNADLARMSQAVTNLLNNAAKYTEKNGEIWVNVTSDDAVVTISVKDNGIGIAPEMLKTVFDLFIQADRAIDRSQGGLGIGLTLVRSLVELHGGSVDVFSEGAGKGSEFIVRLPLHRSVDEEQASIDTLSANVLLLDQLPAATQRILVVDDNFDSALSLAMTLETMGHSVKMAHDGPSAIELANTFKPQIVLLDLGLPGMDGYLVASEIRKNPELSGIKLAALTGYGEEQDRRKTKDAGFDEHFVKPLDFNSLEGLLSSL